MSVVFIMHKSVKNKSLNVDFSHYVVLSILSPCNAGLQQLLAIYTAYGVERDIKYNGGRSAIFICRTKGDKSVKFPDLKLSLCVCDKVQL